MGLDLDMFVTTIRGQKTFKLVTYEKILLRGVFYFFKLIIFFFFNIFTISL